MVLPVTSGAGQGLQDCEPCVAQNPPTPRSPRRKLRIKPVMTNMIHTDVWEGPCRFNVVSVAKETENVRNSYARWVAQVKTGKFDFGPAVELSDPHQVIFDEAFTLPASQLVALDEQKDKVDAFFVSPTGASFAAATRTP